MWNVTPSPSGFDPELPAKVVEGAGAVEPPLISLRGVYDAIPPNQKRREEASGCEFEDGDEEEEVCFEELLRAGVAAGAAGAGVWSAEPVCAVGAVSGGAPDCAKSPPAAISSKVANGARPKHER